MIDKKVLDAMARAEKSVLSHIHDYTQRILTLAEAYRILGNQFTFGSDGRLDAKVNSLLVELSDAVLEDTYASARASLDEEEDKDTVLAWARLTTNVQNTVDKYSSHFKFFLEGWIAIGFANKISKGQLLTDIMAYMDNPYINPLWRDAFTDGMQYATKIIREGGWKWGKGTPISPVKGMALTQSNFINTAYQKGVINGFVRKGAIGYRVVRGSTYDCPYCDELTIGIHPLSEVVLPAHRMCLCRAIPVFEGEE